MKVAWSKDGRRLEVSTFAAPTPLVWLMQQEGDETKGIALTPGEARRVAGLLVGAAEEVDSRG